MAEPYQANARVRYEQLVDPRERRLLGAADLSSQYGNINYDQNQIEGVFQDAVGREYDAKEAAYDRSATQFSNRLGQSQSAYLDAMRQANSQAVLSGAARGAQSANALAAVLGLQQQSTGDATMLAQEQRGLADQRAAVETQATRDAMQYADQNRLAMGTMGANIYGVDAQKYVGELGARAQVADANISASAQEVAAQQARAGQEYMAARNLEGNQYSSDRNLEGTRYSADQGLAANRYTADRNYLGTQYSADRNLAGSQAMANANIAASRNNAAGAVRAAELGLTSSAVQTMGSMTNQQVASLSQFAQTVDDPAISKDIMDLIKAMAVGDKD